MGYGKSSEFSLDLASGATTTSDSIDLGHAWDRVYLRIPTMTSGGTMYIQGSVDNSTFKRVYATDEANGTVQIFQIAQTITNCVVPLPVEGIRYLKVENTTGMTDATTTFKIITG
jgi:hypothetical protein